VDADVDVDDDEDDERRPIARGKMARALTYKDAGVDIETKGTFTDSIPAIMRRTYGPRVIDLPDGFAGLFALDKMGLLAKRYREPVLAACTDGVGTKLKIAFLMDKHDTVGIDLVAMSVNDLITVGAEPLYFLDYIATSKIEPAKLKEILKGIAEGCVQSNCALLGGETAEMAGFYAPGEYDLAGFATGVVERGRIINGGLIRPRDVLIGVASSGLHSNGYTLVRKAFFDEGKMSVGDPVAEFGCPLGEELLRPTKIYAATVARLLAHYKVKHVLHGIANITGGGLRDNIERLLPKRCQARIVKNSWPVPPVFQVLSRVGHVEEEEMYRVFNMGVGLVLIVPEFNADVILSLLKRQGETAWLIGEVRRDKKGVVFAE
jgi:phosphoribosylformylglycinamidine cyclo-ligase